MIAGFFLVCWAGFLVSSVCSTDNLGFVMLRGSSEDSGLRARLDVGSFSPEGMSNSIFLYKDGIWRIPVSPKRPVKAIFLSHANGAKPKDASWEISVSPTSAPHWIPATISWESPRLVLTLDPALTPGSLWPGRKHVLNWLGDRQIVWPDAQRALYVTLLTWFCLQSVRWLWRAAGE